MRIATDHDEPQGEKNLLYYQILDRNKLKNEIYDLQLERIKIEREWEEESCRYEELVERKSEFPSRRPKEIPRRNYFNTEGVVQDMTLFPYHTSCYPLLDAYDCVSTENGEAPLIPPMDRRPLAGGEVFVDTVLITSVAAIGEALLGVQHLYNLHDFQWIIEGVRKTEATSPFRFFEFSLPADNTVITSPADSKYGPSHFPTDPEERMHLFCRLLRHSTSNLQRDYRLATVVLLMLRFTCTSQPLSTILLSMDNLHCDMPCDVDLDHLDHYCRDYSQFATMLGKLITDRLHESKTVLTVSAWVRSSLQESFAYLSPSKGSSVEERRKLWLKRNALSGVVDDPTKDKIPVILLIYMVHFMGRYLDDQVHSLRSGESEIQSSGQLLQSIYHGIQILVEIGWAVIEFCPDQERFYPLASQIVYGLARVYCNIRIEAQLKDNRWNEDDESEEDEDDDLRDYLAATSEGGLISQRITEPFRFADCVTEATQRYQQSHGDWTRSGTVSDAIVNLLNGPPPSEVVDVIRGLFLRELVDKRESGLGYGDFLLWSRSEVTPLDATLYWHDCAYPSSDEEESDEDEADDEESLDWDRDENGYILSRKEMQCRYSFSLLALQEAWTRPWTPESHMSFSTAFRGAAFMLLLCLKEKSVPTGLNFRILQYLNRDWWPDQRDECSDYACQMSRLYKAVKTRNEGRPYSFSGQCLSMRTCPNCHRRYGCNGCLRREAKEHRSNCGKACFLPLTPIVLDFIETIRQNEEPEAQESEGNQNEDEVVHEADFDDQDEDWSSVEESEEENQFRSYRTRRMVEMLSL